MVLIVLDNHEGDCTFWISGVLNQIYISLLVHTCIVGSIEGFQKGQCPCIMPQWPCNLPQRTCAYLLQCLRLWVWRELNVVVSNTHHGGIGCGHHAVSWSWLILMATWSHRGYDSTRQEKNPRKEYDCLIFKYPQPFQHKQIINRATQSMALTTLLFNPFLIRPGHPSKYTVLQLWLGLGGLALYIYILGEVSGNIAFLSQHYGGSVLDNQNLLIHRVGKIKLIYLSKI